MLRIVQLEEIQNHRLSLPALVTRVVKRESNALEAAEAWIEAAERMLLANRLPAAASLATHRLSLKAGADGVLPVGLTAPPDTPRRSLRFLAAGESLRRTAELLHEAVARDELRFADAEGYARQLVVVGRAKQLPAFVETPHVVMAVWQAMLGDSDLVSGALRIQGLTGPQDALVVLDRAMTRDRLTEPNG